MTHEVQLPNGEIAEFPDEMKPEDISAVIKKSFPPTQSISKMDKLNYAFGNNRTPVDTIRDIAAGVIGGLGKGGQLGGRILSGGHNPSVDWEKIENLIGSQKPQSAEGNIARGIGEYAPYGAAGGASLIGQLGAGAASGAASADQGHEVSGAVKGALINALIKGGVSGAQMIGKPIVAKLFRGNLSPEELKQNQNIFAGTNTNIGNVIGSPFLKRMYENILTKIPFSNATETLQKTGGQIIEKGHSILDRLLGENKAEDFNSTLNDALQDAFEEHKQNKIKLYDEFHDESEKSKSQLNLDKFIDTLRENKEFIQNSPILAGDSEGKRLFDKILNHTGVLEKPNLSIKTSNIEVPNYEERVNPGTGENIQVPTGTKNVSYSYKQNQAKLPLNKPLNAQGLVEEQKPTLKDANILKGNLYNYGEQLLSSPNSSDRLLGSIYKKLSASLRQDVKQSVSQSNNPKLINAYNQAEENYQRNFSPFLDKEIYKFAHGNADPDTLISSFLKTGKANDRANLLKKLIDKFPEDKKNLLGYGFLQRAIDQDNVINPLKLNNLISRNSLGPNQFKALFPDPMLRKELLNYSKLVKGNTKALKMMENPETGQMNMDILPLLSRSPTSLIGKVLGARPIQNWMSDEKIRNKVIEQMLNPKKSNPYAAPALQTLIRGYSDK